MAVSIAWLLAAQVASQPPAPAPAGMCLRARPAPACKGFFITSAGIGVGTGAGAGTSPFRMSVDYGAMRNLGRAAIGASWFVNWDQNGTTTGPVVRYRRWIGSRASIDFAIGTPVAANTGFGSDGLLQPGSLLGMVKYNPLPYLGVAVRPEYIRRQDFLCDDVTCIEQISTGARVYAGAEFDGVHGLVTTLVLGLVVLAGLAAQSST